MIRRIPDLTTGLAFPSMSEIVADSVNEIMTNISEIMSCYMEQVCVVRLSSDHLAVRNRHEFVLGGSVHIGRHPSDL